MPYCQSPNCQSCNPGPTPREILNRVEELVAGEDTNYDLPDLFGETNVDDVYSRGIAHGEAIMATKVRELLN